jgi:hypothetical protein
MVGCVLCAPPLQGCPLIPKSGCMMFKRLFSSLTLLLAGCVGIGGDGRSYPSLARRPLEASNAIVMPTAPVPAASVVQPPSDAVALGAMLDRLTAEARRGSSAFEASYPRVAAQVKGATGSAVLSEAWVAANLGISALESARNASVSALASLDKLYADRMNDIMLAKVSGGTDAINVARSEALGLVDAQNDRLDALKSGLRQP